MKAVCFFTNKGGVGKTTLLCNLAGYLALERNLKIAVVDADPQANATQYMFPEEFIEEVYDLDTIQTVYDYVRPVTQGKGFQKDIHLQRSKNFPLIPLTHV
ncbi:MAG TPA: ParA family protein [Sphingopyxis sp.]|nr:ParA family protein [Sphingopyxis sp.]